MHSGFSEASFAIFSLLALFVLFFQLFSLFYPAMSNILLYHITSILSIDINCLLDVNTNEEQTDENFRTD